jgi:hypothetical protein
LTPALKRIFVRCLSREVNGSPEDGRFKNS